MRDKMKKIISLLLLVGAVSANAASLELIVKKQKTLPNGNAYGLESGIYFELTDLEPFVMYKLQYSRRLEEVDRLGSPRHLSNGNDFALLDLE